MKIMLIIPPIFDHTMPNLALPCLTATLKDAGHSVVQKDVNIEAYDTFLSKEELERACERYRTRKDNFKFLGYIPKNVDMLTSKKDYLINEVENAKNLLRSTEEFYDYKRYKESVTILENCMSLISASYYRTELSFGKFLTAYSSDSTEQIFKAIKDEYCNPFIDFYRRYTIPDIQSEMPDMIGISITSSFQLIPALTLAYMIKQAMKDVHVVIGGIYFSRMKNNIEKNQKLFTLFDSVLVGEGETAITKLADSLEKGLPLGQVPNLIYKNDSGLMTSGFFHTENINELPTPCFDGLPFHLYLSPKLVLPMYATRGCYWGKCAFCDLVTYYEVRCRVRSAEKLKEDMKLLSHKYNCNTFAFVDDAIHPSHMEKLSDLLIQEGIDVNWSTHARFEKQFNYELLKKLAAAGCRVLAFGLESASSRVIELIEKGTEQEQMSRILEESSRAGILNHISFFFGFPTETFEEARETMNFVLQNIKYISSVVCVNYMLYKNSKVFQELERYKITSIYEEPGYDLPFTVSKFSAEGGLTQAEARKLAELFFKILIEAGVVQLNNSHMYLYCIHYKVNDLSWLTAPDEESRLLREQRFKDAVEKIPGLLAVKSEK